MTIVNIRRDVDDRFYRYRMPLLEIKIEGRGNGIKTVIPNMSDISRALSRPPTYPTKYFGCELGAQTVIDEKGDRYIVNGAHDANRLRELLDGFIDRFVLCGNCKNPETDLKLKNGDIYRDCKACGKRTLVDMGHKLTTYINKNPPPKRAKGAKGAGKAAGQSVSAGGDDDEGEDDESSPYSQFGAWILEQREAGHQPSAMDVYKKAQEFGIEKKHKTAQVLFQALFGEDAPKQVETYAPMLIKMITSEKHQKAMLGGIERLAGIECPALVPNGVPKLLMALYQIDVLDEEVARNWGTHVSKKYVDKDTSKRVRKAAAPFLEWLDQADSEEDDDDDDEEGDDDDEQDDAPAANGDSSHQPGDSDLDDL